MGGFWAADGMGYGDGLEEKLKRKEKKERERGISAEGFFFLGSGEKLWGWS